MNAEKSPKPKKSVSDAIKEHHELLSTVGILAAVSLFAQQISILWIAASLSFFFLTAMMFAAYELIRVLPEENESKESLYWFSVALTFALMTLFVYWLVRLKEVYEEGFFFAISVFSTYFALILFVRPLLRYVERRRKLPSWTESRIFGLVIALSLFIGFFVLYTGLIVQIDLVIGSWKSA